jgi:chromate reductase
MRAAQELAPEGMTIRPFERLGELPHYNQDLDTEGRIPEPAAALRATIRAADALLIATPEYNYGIPGVLKNAIDWASRPPQSSALKGKAAAIMGASGGMSGTMRAQLHLRQAFVFTETYAVLKPEVYVSFAREKFDADGRLTDETARTLIRQLLEALRDLSAERRKGSLKG